jgi:uncharacterized protein
MRVRLITSCLLAGGFGLAASSLLVTNNALHVPHRIPQSDAADALARTTDSSWTDVQVTARDGVILRAWLFTPPEPNGSAVIALHGVADSRMGMLAHAEFLLRSGFTVLVPDCRGYGASGGELITYGVRESGDVRCWSDRLLRDRRLHRLYGIGQSMGASILLQSLTAEPRFRALVADCPFATFEEIAYERLAQISGFPQFAFWPIIRAGFVYTRIADGVDLRQASPAAVIRTTHVPILLIHGSADSNIPPHHSLELHALNPGATQIWIVPGAGHVESLATAPHMYARNVVAWFSSHP